MGRGVQAPPPLLRCVAGRLACELCSYSGPCFPSAKPTSALGQQPLERLNADLTSPLLLCPLGCQTPSGLPCRRRDPHPPQLCCAASLAGSHGMAPGQ